MKRQAFLSILAILCLLSSSLQAQTITRGPYLQSVHEESITIKWRTNTATLSRVWYGATASSLNSEVIDETVTTEHQVLLSGLQPNTFYFYAVGDNNGPLAGADEQHYFKTTPLPNTGETLHMWVLGDAGKKNDNQRAVRDAFYNYNGNTPIDCILMLGDNAYSDGTESDFQQAWFENMYEERLINTPMYPCFGNHDGHSADSDTESGAYYDIFTLPRNGECGGVPSGTEAYYSANYGDVHIISLNSYDVDRSPGGAMMQWLEADLAANDRNWTVALFHHPSYDGRDDNVSDTKEREREMRENAVPLLEAGGTDLVLMGHAHTIQRSMLIEGHYGIANTFDPDAMALDQGDGQLDGDGAYQKGADNKGTVYMIAGTAGSVNSNVTLEHPIMYYNALTLGSVILDVNHDQMDVTFLSVDGIVDDYFTIQKDIVPVELIAITNPLHDFPAPQNVIITTELSEAIGTISEVQFLVNEQVIGTDNTFPFNLPWTIPANGTYDFEVIATSTFGTYTDSVQISVGPNTPPYPADSDGDGTPDTEDLCDGSLEPGTVCNDNTPTTYDDLITADCNCVGTPYDCPSLLADIGTTCDDGNAATYNDVIDANCTCAGTPWDCPTLLMDIGSSCDDNNPATYGEMVNDNCECVGIALGAPTTIFTKVASKNDDAEEGTNGNVNLGSSDLELVTDASNQTIGIRFAHANIPEGAIIVEAYIQFTSDEVDGGVTNLNVYGEKNISSATFTSVNQNITDRTKTDAFAEWTPSPWQSEGEANANQQSADLTSIVQEIVDLPGYTSSSALIFIINGTGKRVAHSYNGNAQAAPELVVTYAFSCTDNNNNGICDEDDPCANGQGVIGGSCDDGDPATYNDIFDADCNCSGTAYDCPLLFANIGDSCNDNNSSTNNDAVTSDCNCSGVLTTYSCPSLQANIGDSCNDNNADTFNDEVTADCTCEGQIMSSTSITVAITQKSDDAEERSNGSVSIYSSDLEMTKDGSNVQTIGMRFTDVGIPVGAVIQEAYIQFTADENMNVDPCVLDIYGEASDQASTFAKQNDNISNRSKTNAVVQWSPTVLWQKEDATLAQRTTNIATLIQEVIDRPGYVYNNPISILIEGIGIRVAKSYDGNSGDAPKLLLTYGFECIDEDNDGICLPGDPCPNTPGVPGTPCDDGDNDTFNDVVDDNCNCTGQVPTGFGCARIVATSDDAEEKSNGDIKLRSSDLELTHDGSDQTIGLRFLNLQIPPGAVINAADIQFTVDEVKNTNPCLLTIFGELHENPAAFSDNDFNISSRTKTNTYVSWMPEEWLSVNEAGINQQTIDIAPILQEIVDQPDYEMNNPIVIIINGEGTRTAESYDGEENKAAELCVEYDATTLSNATIYEAEEEVVDQEEEDLPLNKLFVFPNPAKDHITLRFDANNKQKEATVQIWDMNGRLVYNKKRIIEAGDNDLLLESLSLPNGTYTVQLFRDPFLKAAKFVIHN